jgi:hypothetical protein
MRQRHGEMRILDDDDRHDAAGGEPRDLGLVRHEVSPEATASAPENRIPLFGPMLRPA